MAYIGAGLLLGALLFVASPAIAQCNFGGRDTITFGSTTIATNLLATALEFSGGVSA